MAAGYLQCQIDNRLMMSCKGIAQNEGTMQDRIVEMAIANKDAASKRSGRSRSPRAYALRLTREVTRIIEAFRDPTLEAVIKAGGTPSALAMKAFTFEKCGQFPWIKPRIRGCKVYTLEWGFRDPCSSCELLQLTGVRNDPCFGGCKTLPMVLWNTNRMVQSEPLLRRRGLM